MIHGRTDASHVGCIENLFCDCLFSSTAACSLQPRRVHTIQHRDKGSQWMGVSSVGKGIVGFLRFLIQSCYPDVPDQYHYIPLIVRQNNPIPHPLRHTQAIRNALAPTLLNHTMQKTTNHQPQVGCPTFIIPKHLVSYSFRATTRFHIETEKRARCP